MTAGIAFLDILHMAAQRGRAAVADGVKGSSLMSAGYVAPLREEVCFVPAEDIGHFRPVFRHRSGLAAAGRMRSIAPSISSGLFVERKALSER